MFNLRPYQITSKEYAISHPYCILALEQGLGKTLVSLCASDETKSRTLVVCPAYLFYNWYDEIKKFFPSKIVSVIRKSKDVYPLWDTDICIVPYTALTKADVLFQWATHVIIDEAHYLKNPEAKRTEDVHRQIYQYGVKRLTLLTGTPIQNQVWEFYSLMSLCYYNPRLKNPEFLERFPTYIDFAEYFSYRRQYQVPTKWGMRTVVKYEGIKNEQELRNKWLKDIYIRFTAEECLKDLPDFTVKEILMSDSPDFNLLTAFNSFIEGSEGKTNASTKAQSAKEKADFTASYVKDLNEQGIDKIVVYTDHVESCEEIAKKLGVRGIHGGVSMEVRRLVAKAFIEGDSRFIVATVGSFSTGITLTRAHHMVFNDYPWVPGALDQAFKRIHRIGQTKHCVYHMILGSPQDKYILSVIKEKKETIKAVL